MDFENNKNEQCHSNHDIEELDRIRNQVINNFSSNSSDFYSSSNNNENGSVTLALDDLTVKNIKFMATVIKVLSILGIIVGVFQIIILLLLLELAQQVLQQRQVFLICLQILP